MTQRCQTTTRAWNSHTARNDQVLRHRNVLVDMVKWHGALQIRSSKTTSPPTYGPMLDAGYSLLGKACANQHRTMDSGHDEVYSVTVEQFIGQ